MKIFTKFELEQAVQLLKDGGVLMYPTETSYALGCDATNDVAVVKVFAIKDRPEGKGTPLIIPSQTDAAEFIELSDTARELTEAYWPGPLNIVARRAASSAVSSRCETEGTQSVRKSSHPLASKLAELLGKPLVATSANRSGETSLYSAEDVRAMLSADSMIDGFVDVGDLPVVPASTTVHVEGDKIEVLRQGSIYVR